MGLFGRSQESDLRGEEVCNYDLASLHVVA
jgi:hypothetical protein